MNVSVALCTYNGQAYIGEQLDSIFNQTHPINELIICDDGSTDGTENIIKNFVLQYPGIITFYKNIINLGYARNFEKTLSLTKGHIIFLSDQDDRWAANKVERFLEVFEAHPLIKGIFCDAFVMNEKNEDMGYSIWESIVFKHRQDLHQNNELLYDYILKTYNVVTGCCIALKKDALKKMLPFERRFAGIHDEYIALKLLANNSLYALKECLGYYRTHGKQNVGIPGQEQWAAIEVIKNDMYHNFLSPATNADAMVRLFVYYEKRKHYSAVYNDDAALTSSAYHYFLLFRKEYLNSLSFFERRRTLLSWWRKNLYGTTLVALLKG